MHTSRFPALSLVLVLLTCPSLVAARASAAEPEQAVRAIPGLTARDAFPNGCVDCHTSMSKAGDTRLSTLLANWSKAVEPALVDRAKAASADPSKVKGKHPPVPKAGANVPQTCLATCHRQGSKVAPAFATLMHAVHLTGEKNQFMANFQGECTHCHKLDQKTGAWRMPSGAEK
jgi:hypothetical protein